MICRLRQGVSSSGFALFVLVTIVALYGTDQEVVARYLPHDDYYFLLRSDSFGLKGSYLAPIKEMFYPLFIKIPRVYGISLRLFEALSYGAACFFLWYQIVRLAKSRTVGWLTIIPLALLPYQHAVFNHVTYDALQLILMPLTFASAIQISLNRGNRASLLTAGLIAGLQAINRPEGFLFIFPPLVSVVFLGARSLNKLNWRSETMHFLRRAALVLLVPVAFQQIVSAVNQYRFGFWAPTIMKSSSYQASLAALMSIQPAESAEDRYAPVPKSSLMRAYEVSPEFRKAKPFFDQHMDGEGWSGHALPGYRALDGSISGGHFQWALLDAGAFVAGVKHKAILAYFDAVARELELAIHNGELPKRRVVSTAVGPNFSVLNKHFWMSLQRIGRPILNLGEPVLPAIAGISPVAEVESDFNRLALRRVALLQSERWSLAGWALDPTSGVPKNIALDEEARNAGVTLDLVSRPDVVQIVLKLNAAQTPTTKCGFRLSSPGPWSGHLIVEYENSKSAVPLVAFKSAISGSSVGRDGIHVQVDSVAKAKPRSEHTHFVVVGWVSAMAHIVMRTLVIVLVPTLAALVVLRARTFFSAPSLASLYLIAALVLSVVLPRVGLLAAIDSVMYPGTEPRYLAAAAFSVWLFASFATAVLLKHVARYLFGTRHSAKWTARDVKQKGAF